MSIKIVKGDMVKSMLNNELQAYAHQANCFCTMGRGIAPLLVEANPEVLKVDKEIEKGCPYKLGKFSVTTDKTKSLVYNIYGQFHWSKFKINGERNTDYNALESVLELAFEDMWDKGIKALGVPLIGCGLAGGDWKIVKEMIIGISDWYQIDVTVFVLDDKYLED
mgnify:FL=1